MRHPNILHYHGRLSGTSALVTEYLSKTIDVDGEEVTINNVRQLLDELEDDVPWALRLQIAQETANGLSYLNDIDCLHCDLKAANVFLGGDGEEWVVKIGDFGEARAEHKDVMMTQLSAQDPQNTVAGTLPFLAPEVLRGQTHTKKSDVYSYAMLLVELLCPSRSNPRAKDCKPMCIATKVMEEKRPSLPASAKGITTAIFNAVVALIQRCWDENPTRRPDFKEIIKDLEKITAMLVNDGKMNAFTNALEDSKTNSGSEDKISLSITNLSLHQGTIVERAGQMSASFVEKGTAIPIEIEQAIENQVRELDGSNCCAFFSIAIANWLQKKG